MNLKELSERLIKIYVGLLKESQKNTKRLKNLIKLQRENK